MDDCRNARPRAQDRCCLIPRLFIPASLLIGAIGIAWGVPTCFGRGVSVGSMPYRDHDSVFGLGLLCDRCHNALERFE